MSCKHPLKAWPVGLTVNNKIKYKITDYDVDHVEVINQEKINCVYDKSVSPYASKVIYEYKEIPCGKCIECRLAYSRQWADRCLLEMKQHDKSYFVTFTYNNEHLRKSEFVDKSTGVVNSIPTLMKRDFQLMMKRLRKDYKAYLEKNHLDEYLSDKIRFFAAGEYGDQTHRPHYHAIIFGLHLFDLEFYMNSKLGFPYYKSQFMQYVWSERDSNVVDLMDFKKCKDARRQIGYVVIAPATWETCAYTARYILKKQKGKDAEIYENLGIEPEFSLMSRKPGIGRDYFDQRGLDMFEYDFVSIDTPEGGKKIYPNRYFKKLFQQMDEDQFEIYRNRMEENNKDLKNIKLESTSMRYLDMLQVEERIKLGKLKALKREL